MIKQVWKYILNSGLTTVNLPIGYKILSVGEQNDNICMWVEVNPENNTIERQFEVFGTGHDIQYNIGDVREYLGTVKFYNELLILHVYHRIS